MTGMADRQQVPHVVTTASAAQLDVMDMLGSVLANGVDPRLTTVVRSRLDPFLRL
jgi:hypothetical protein